MCNGACLINYIYKKKSQHTNIQALGGIRTHDRWERAPVDLRLRPRGHWDRHMQTLQIYLKHLHDTDCTSDEYWDRMFPLPRHYIYVTKKL